LPEKEFRTIDPQKLEKKAPLKVKTTRITSQIHPKLPEVRTITPLAKAKTDLIRSSIYKHSPNDSLMDQEDLKVNLASSSLQSKLPDQHDPKKHFSSFEAQKVTSRTNSSRGDKLEWGSSGKQVKSIKFKPIQKKVEERGSAQSQPQNQEKRLRSSVNRAHNSQSVRSKKGSERGSSGSQPPVKILRVKTNKPGNHGNVMLLPVNLPKDIAEALMIQCNKFQINRGENKENSKNGANEPSIDKKIGTSFSTGSNEKGECYYISEETKDGRKIQVLRQYSNATTGFQQQQLYRVLKDKDGNKQTMEYIARSYHSAQKKSKNSEKPSFEGSQITEKKSLELYKPLEMTESENYEIQKQGNPLHGQIWKKPVPQYVNKARKSRIPKSPPKKKKRSDVSFNSPNHQRGPKLLQPSDNQIKKLSSKKIESDDEMFPSDLHNRKSFCSESFTDGVSDDGFVSSLENSSNNPLGYYTSPRSATQSNNQSLFGTEYLPQIEEESSEADYEYEYDDQGMDSGLQNMSMFNDKRLSNDGPVFGLGKKKGGHKQFR